MNYKTTQIIFCLLACLITNNSSAQQWSQLGGNTLAANNIINSICSDRAGNIYAVGSFTNTYPANYVAKWNGNGWTALGGSSLAANEPILSICSDTAGNIYAAGLFTDTSGNYYHYVAKWDGNAWTELGSGVNALAANDIINSICSDASGNIYAAGNFTNGSGYNYVAKWNGNGWTELGGTNDLAANGPIQTICSDRAGNIYAAGSFSNGYHYYVAKWNYSGWSELGGLNALSANNVIQSICTDTFGNIYASNFFSDSSGTGFVYKWNDTLWKGLGDTTNPLPINCYPPNSIQSICSDASGNIYAAGFLTNSLNSYWGTNNFYVAKWNDTLWSELQGTDSLAANAVESVTEFNSGIYSVCSDASGNIYAGGYFASSLVGNPYVARYGSVQVVNNQWFDTICQGASVAVGSHIYMAGGTYTDSLKSLLGWDSIVTLHLTVNTVSASTVSLNFDSLVALKDVSSFNQVTDTTYIWFGCYTSPNPPVFKLRGGTPVGGIYSGDFIINDTFYVPFNAWSMLGSYETSILYSYTDTNGCISQAIDSILLTNCFLGINDLPAQPAISLYPNPNNGSFTLTTARTNTEFIITDLLGRVVAHDLIKSDTQAVDLDIPAGIYSLAINGVQPLKFVLMR